MEHQVTQQSASWTMSELAGLFAGGTRSIQPITGVRVDSRLVEPGDLFVALAGDPRISRQGNEEITRLNQTTVHPHASDRLN